MLRRTRRAPKACSWCHHRKVRCDASIRGCPCTRCRQDGRPECVLRGKLPRNFGGFVVQQQQTADQDDRHTTTTRGRLESITSNTNSQLEHIRSLIPDLDIRDPAPSLPRGHVNYTVYKFLDFRGAASLPREDVAFLSSKGSLAVPERGLMNEFIRQYFLQIHPSMPVLDEAEVWDIYEQRDGETDAGRISLFVFQALLFSSCPYVSQETLQKCGFEDKRSARNTFFKRAKFLFDLQGEDRPFIIAQGSTMLSHHTSAEEPQAGSLWLTRAIQNAMIIGCPPGPNGPSEEIESALKKRLWWSIILRDRSLCLGLRRRPQVTTLDFGIGIAADLIEETDMADEIEFSRVYDPATKRMLLKVLQEQCRLAVMLTEMISLVFASHGLSSPSLSMEQFHEALATVSRIRGSLKQWETCSQLSALLDSNTADAVTVLTKYTYMYYHTARIDLAHYEALLVENHLVFAGDNYIKQVWETGNTLRDAMDHLIDIMEYFSREGRAQNLPLSLLAYVGMPLVLTAIDLKLSRSTDEMDDRRRRLDALGEIIRHSGRVYDVTDFVSAGTNHILQLAYMTAQHLFLRWDSDPTSPTPAAQSASVAASQPGFKPTSQTDLVSTTQSGAMAGRANSWFDAFLRYPRAYLLISTSVDYSLSVGRLPYDSALPELVRCIPPIGIGIRLPWTVNNAVGAPPQKNNRRLSQMRRKADSVPRSPVKTLTPSSSTSVDQPLPDFHPVQHDVPVVSNRFNMADPSEEEAQQMTDGPVNLDYLYLDAIPVEDSPPVPPEYGEYRSEHHETEAERWQLRETTASFDPLISSWVQEFFGDGQPNSPGRMEVDGTIILDS
ncbi:hypothetical protein FE257_003341 [Aspergillus nanangensis]|uniref:Zn(2)-C6 fungal-type domain-containing protein n=1 Tax=Aspergillus nanangensis TaxID=2582783 RepID=A0AAD4CSD4_ASPNN|nr:hypothetical protein FE257_003341 [Aspergillus nanangensis]